MITIVFGITGHGLYALVVSLYERASEPAGQRSSDPAIPTGQDRMRESTGGGRAFMCRHAWMVIRRDRSLLHRAFLLCHGHRSIFGRNAVTKDALDTYGSYEHLPAVLLPLAKDGGMGWIGMLLRGTRRGNQARRRMSHISNWLAHAQASVCVQSYIPYQ